MNSNQHHHYHQYHSEARVFIALGANLGNPVQQINSAVESIAAHPKINVTAMSKIYRSKPHGPQEQNDFINAVIEVRTSLPPLALLSELQKIEHQHGRQHDHQHDKGIPRWGPRLLDLDIILYDDITMTSNTLTLPHPYAHQREFVIQPLCDLDDTLILPMYGKVSELLQHLPTDTLKEISHEQTFNR